MEALLIGGCVAVLGALAVVLRRAEGDLPCVSAVRWSPNRAPRNGALVTTLVWHYTAGPTARGAIDWLCNPASNASAHFVIGRDGRITQLVRLAESAWHVGQANLGNARTIGVELVNVGQVEKDWGGRWNYRLGDKLYPWQKDAEPRWIEWALEGAGVVRAWWVPYTEAQKQACARLVRDLERSAYRPVAVDMVGHHDIARPAGRKVDPGPLFPWDLFPGRRVRGRAVGVV